MKVFETEDLIDFLKKGSSILFPTDTLPALAALPQHATNLWKLKNRPKNKPLILMGSSAEQLFPYVLAEALDDAREIGSSFWPGAITIVLPATGQIVRFLNLKDSSIGLRVPACDMALNFLKKSGPLASTSANLSGFQPAIYPEDASKYFPEVPLLAPIPWPKPSGLASTVIQWKGIGQWHLIRRGAVIPSGIEK